MWSGMWISLKNAGALLVRFEQKGLDEVTVIVTAARGFSAATRYLPTIIFFVIASSGSSTASRLSTSGPINARTPSSLL